EGVNAVFEDGRRGVDEGGGVAVGRGDVAHVPVAQRRQGRGRLGGLAGQDVGDGREVDRLVLLGEGGGGFDVGLCRDGGKFPAGVGVLADAQEELADAVADDGLDAGVGGVELREVFDGGIGDGFALG